MFEMRIWKDFLTKIVVIVVLLGVCAFSFTLFGSDHFFDANDSSDADFWKYRVPPSAKSHIMENACKWPIIEEMNEKMTMKRRKINSNLCTHNWWMKVELDDNSILNFDFDDENAYLMNTTVCFYTKIALNGERQQRSEINWKRRQRVFDPVFSVHCDSGDETIFEQTFHNWEKLIPNSQKTYSDSDDDEPISLSFIALPFLGSSRFQELFPKTSEFMRTENFVSLKMFNQISENAIENLLHLTKGQNDESLIEIADAKGCVTIINEDSHIFNQTSAFQDEAHINFMNFYNWNKTNNNVCNRNGKTIYEEFLQNFHSSAFLRNSKCVSSFNYFSQFPYLTDMEISHFDSTFKMTLEKMKVNSLYERMVFVIVGVNSKTGMEETMADIVASNNPFLAIRIPRSYRSRNVIRSYNLEQNAKRLLSNWDIYETIREFISPSRNVNELSRGISLLSQEISIHSTCSSKGIPHHLCLCMEENMEQSNKLSNETQEYQRIFESVQDYLTQIKCVDKVSPETRDFGPHARVYSLSSNISSLISNRNNLYDYIEIGYKTKTIERQSPRLRSLKITGVARLRRDPSTNELEVINPVPVLEKPKFCWARDLSAVCELCAGEFILSN